jgi:hypothetical protein
MPETPELEAALELFRRREPLLPVIGKRPAVKDWQTFVATRANLHFWFGSRRANVGLRCGRRVVLDLDSEEAKEFALKSGVDPPEMRVLTGGGGEHWYFRTPEGIVIGNRVKVHGLFDVRGQGGFVVYPPSIHPETKESYRLLTRYVPVEELPPFPVQILVEPRQKPQTVLVPDVDARVARARRYIAKIVSVEFQGGDLQAFRCACALIQKFRLSYEQALPLMIEWNQTNALPPWPLARLEYKLSEAQRLMK